MVEMTVDLKDEQVGVIFTLQYLQREIEDINKEIEDSKSQESGKSLKYLEGKKMQCYLTRKILQQFL